MEGNISLFQQLRPLEMRNDMLLLDAFRPEFLAQLEIKAPIRIPRPFATDPAETVPRSLHRKCRQRCRKLDRNAWNIDRLIAEGEKSASAFLRDQLIAVSNQSSSDETKP